MSLSTFSQMSPSKVSPTFSQAQRNNKEKIGDIFYNFDDNENSPTHSKSTLPGRALERTNGFNSNEGTLKGERQSHSANKTQKSTSEHVREKSVNPNESMDKPGPDIKTFTSIGSANKTKDKEIQMQLEVSQSRLHGLAKRIDDCLLASKVNYSDSKVMQPSVPSVPSVESEKSSLNEIKDSNDVNASPKETQQITRPEVKNEKVVESKESPKAMTKSNMVSRESTAEEKVGLIDQLDKKKNNLNKNKVEPKPKVQTQPQAKETHKPEVKETSKPQAKEVSKPQVKETLKPQAKEVPKPQVKETPKPQAKEVPKPQVKEAPKPQSKSKEPQKQTPKIKVQSPSPTRDNKKNTGSPRPDSIDIQKQLDTISSVSLETNEDLPKQKEYQQYNLGNSSSFAPSSMFKESTVSQSKTKVPEKPANVQAHTSPNKAVVNQVKSPIKDNRFSFSNSVETGSNSKKTNPTENINVATKTSPIKIDKTKVQKSDKKGSRKISEADSGMLSKRTLNMSNYEFEKDNQNDDRDINDLIDQSEMSHPPMPQKFEPLNMGISRHSSKADNQHHLSSDFLPSRSNIASDFSRKKVDLKLDAYLEEKFDMHHNISPVLNDRRSSRGTRDLFTPAGYNFDGNNMSSMNDLKNLSFDSSFLGKDAISAKGTNEKVRERSGFGHKTMEVKSQDDLKSNKSMSRALSQGRKDTSYNGEDLESSFTKAYTFRKNKLVQDVGKFDDRMQSDIYLRRRFRNDLNKFLEEYKPKITEEEAEMLYHRLAEDAKRREVKALKVQLESERNHKTPIESYPSIPEDQLNQTFERLVADARKRLFVQEEKEKMKILKEEEDEKAQIRANSKKKISREAEERMVDKFTADAHRRRLKHEKLERAKIEDEDRKASELQSQGFKLKNNHAKSKIKDYIDSKADKSADERVERAKLSKSMRSFRSERKVRNEESVEFEDEGFSNVLDKNQASNHKFSNIKTRYLNIASPTNKVGSSNSASKVGTKAKSAVKGDSLSNLEYLKHLREDIRRHKTDIEGHIESITNVDIVSPSHLKDKSSMQQSRSDIKKLSLSGIHSPKNDQPSTTPYKVPNKYKNVESKVAKHIVTPQTKTNPSSDTKKKDQKDTPSSKKSLPGSEKSGSKIIKTPGREGKTTERHRKNESEDHEKKSRPQTKFMNAQDAMHFVEKLINDFKSSNNI